MNLDIVLILATGRPGRKSAIVANLVKEEATKFGLPVELIDVVDWLDKPTTGPQSKTKDWQARVDKADGFIIVSPEYNRGYPGELKLLLDQAYKEYWRKPVGFVGVSSGPIGGARMVEQLRLVCNELHLAPIRTAVYVKNVVDETVVNERLINEVEYHKPLEELFTELKWWAEALKVARENK